MYKIIRDGSGKILLICQKKKNFIGLLKLKKVDLRGADLRGAYLKWADLEEANLRGADLEGADLEIINTSL